jgi:hypothetical protein
MPDLTGLETVSVCRCGPTGQIGARDRARFSHCGKKLSAASRSHSIGKGHLRTFDREKTMEETTTGQRRCCSSTVSPTRDLPAYDWRIIEQGRCSMDLLIEAISDTNRVAVTGQLLDASHTELVVRDVPVTRSNRLGDLVHAATNEFGEFYGEVENSGELELSLPIRRGRWIVISLKNALGAGGQDYMRRFPS